MTPSETERRRERSPALAQKIILTDEKINKKKVTSREHLPFYSDKDVSGKYNSQHFRRNSQPIKASEDMSDVLSENELLATHRRSSLPVLPISNTVIEKLSPLQDSVSYSSQKSNNIHRNNLSYSLPGISRSRRSSLASTTCTDSHWVGSPMSMTRSSGSQITRRSSGLDMSLLGSNSYQAEKRLLFTQMSTIAKQVAKGQGLKTASMSDIEATINKCQTYRKYSRRSSLLNMRQLPFPNEEIQENEEEQEVLAVPRFSTSLSPEAQYAILKDYDDVLIEKLKGKFPDKSHYIQRGKTPLGKVLLVQYPNNSNYLPSNQNMEQRLHLSKNLQKAIDIIDHIKMTEGESTVTSPRVLWSKKMPNDFVKNYISWSQTWKKQFVLES